MRKQNILYALQRVHLCRKSMSSSVQEAKERFLQNSRRKEEERQITERNKEAEREVELLRQKTDAAIAARERTDRRQQREAVIKTLNPGKLLFEQVCRDVSSTHEVRASLLSHIEEHGSEDIVLVKTAPVMCGGYWYRHKIQEPKHNYLGNNVDPTEEELTDSLRAVSPQSTTIPTGPFKDWNLSIESRRRLFGIWGYSALIVLHERKRWSFWPF